MHGNLAVLKMNELKRLFVPEALKVLERKLVYTIVLLVLLRSLDRIRKSNSFDFEVITAVKLFCVKE